MKAARFAGATAGFVILVMVGGPEFLAAACEAGLVALLFVGGILFLIGGLLFEWVRVSKGWAVAQIALAAVTVWFLIHTRAPWFAWPVLLVPQWVCAFGLYDWAESKPQHEADEAARKLREAHRYE